MRSFKNVSPFGDLVVSTGGPDTYYVKAGEVLDVDNDELAAGLAESPSDWQEQTPATPVAPPAPSPSPAIVPAAPSSDTTPEEN